MIWACPARFPFPLLLLTENHFLGESPFFIMASRLCHQVAASQLFLQLPFTHPAPAIPQTDDPLPDITTWHRLFPQQEIPSHHLPLPVYGSSSLPTYPPILRASISSWHPLLLTKPSGSRKADLILPHGGSYSSKPFSTGDCNGDLLAQGSFFSKIAPI